MISTTTFMYSPWPNGRKNPRWPLTIHVIDAWNITIDTWKITIHTLVSRCHMLLDTRFHIMTWQKHQFSSMKNVVHWENIGFHRCKLLASFSQTCARGKGWGTFGCCLCADNFESCTPIVPNARFWEKRAFGTIGVQLSKLSAQRQQPKRP